MEKKGIYCLCKTGRKKQRYTPVSWLTPFEQKSIPTESKERLIKLVLKLNTEVLNLFTSYVHLWEEWTKFNPKGTTISSQEVNEFLRSIVTPPNGPTGCSDFELSVRKKYYKEDKTECPYYNCRYWIDNADWANCFHLVNKEASKEDGWTLDQIAKVPNLIIPGTVSRERIRQLEVSALTKIAEKSKNIPDILDFLKKIGKRKEE